jgi:hypothetical protein
MRWYTAAQARRSASRSNFESSSVTRDGRVQPLHLFIYNPSCHTWRIIRYPYTRYLAIPMKVCLDVVLYRIRQHRLGSVRPVRRESRSEYVKQLTPTVEMTVITSDMRVQIPNINDRHAPRTSKGSVSMINVSSNVSACRLVALNFLWTPGGPPRVPRYPGRSYGSLFIGITMQQITSSPAFNRKNVAGGNKTFLLFPFVGFA